LDLPALILINEYPKPLLLLAARAYRGGNLGGNLGRVTGWHSTSSAAKSRR